MLALCLLLCLTPATVLAEESSEPANYSQVSNDGEDNPGIVVNANGGDEEILSDEENSVQPDTPTGEDGDTGAGDENVPQDPAQLDDQDGNDAGGQPGAPAGEDDDAGEGDENVSQDPAQPDDQDGTDTNDQDSAPAGEAGDAGEGSESDPQDPAQTGGQDDGEEGPQEGEDTSEGENSSSGKEDVPSAGSDNGESGNPAQGGNESGSEVFPDGEPQSGLSKLPSRAPAAPLSTEPRQDEVERTEIQVPFALFDGYFLDDIFSYRGDVGFKTPGAYTLLVTENQNSAKDKQNELLTIDAGYDVLLKGQTGKEVLWSKAPTGDVEPVAGTKIQTNPLFVVEDGGKLTISDLELDGNLHANLIVVKAGGTLILEEGAVLTNCSGSAIINYGKLIMNGGTITNCDAQQTKSHAGNGAVLNGPGGFFQMTGGTISGNGNQAKAAPEDRAYTDSTGHAGGVTNLGTFTMTGGSITGNGYGMAISTMAAGGVYNGGSFTLGGGAAIRNNTTVIEGHVGGVYNAPNAQFTLQGEARIDGNKAAQSGGGVYNAAGGTFTMDGGTISGHTVTQFGGGVYNATGGRFTMNGGTISGNTSKSDGSTTALNVGTGGGVYNGGLFTMNGGTIRGNTATKGGGIHSGNPLDDSGDAKFLMTGGTIEDNTADANGGGLFVFTNSTAIICRGSIINNTAKAINGGGFGGGGIYVNQHEENEEENGTLYLYNVAIYHNISGTGNDSDGHKEGSGIAACSYSNVHIYMTDGGAIFDNKSQDGSRQPQIFVAEPDDQDPERTHVVQLSRYMLGGGAYNWTDAKGTLLTDDQLRANEITAYNTITTDSAAAESALAKAKVTISGNTSADRGGGIGCNGNLYIGRGPENILRIQKQVSGPASQNEFAFTLTLTTSEGDPYTDAFSLALNDGGAQTVRPDAKGQYTITLPAGGQAECLDLPTGTKYTVTEAAAGNCQTSVNGMSGTSTDGTIAKNAIVTLTFLNTYSRPSTPAGTTSGPSPTATPAPKATPVPSAAPATSAAPAAVTTASIPQTGDTSQPILWWTLMVVSSVGLAALFLRKKTH